MGGWLNESMVEWFADYANIIYREFGPKVKIFTTINEPKVYCFLAYVRGKFAPGKKLDAAAGFLCGHNMLKAHARVYHLYDSEYRSSQNGKIGFVSICVSYIPKKHNETLAAEIGFQFSCGWLANPIFVGDYSQLVKDKLAQISSDAGLVESMLPKFSPEWIDYIRGTSDFFGLIHYTSNLVELGPKTVLPGSDDDFLPDIGISKSFDPRWESPDGERRIAPEGFGHLLRTIKNKYNNPPVYVLENGVSAAKDGLNDYIRMRYHHSYLKELLLAVHRDGCNVQRYSFGSLLDNFEWNSGYARSYGLFSVNFTSPNRERTPKVSMSWVKSLLRTRKLQSQLLPSANPTPE